MPERTAEDRERELVRRQLARQAHLSRRPRRFWWIHGVALVCFLAAAVIGTTAMFGQLSVAAIVALLLVGVAALTN